MRLFVAIELDEPGRQAIAAELLMLKSALDGEERSSMRWVKPEHMHLTLVFLGEVAEDRVRVLVGALSHPIPLAPFIAGFGGLGIFPPRQAPRVLWLGLTRGVAEVREVRREVAQNLSRVGVVPEEHFEPHLTLARWRPHGAGRRPRVQLGAPGELLRLSVEHVALIESRLSSAGPSYSVLAKAILEVQRRPPLQSEA